MRSICAFLVLSAISTTINGSGVVREYHALRPRQEIFPRAAPTTTASADAKVTESTSEPSDPKGASRTDKNASTENTHRAKGDSTLDNIVRTTSSLRPASSETTAVLTASATQSASSSKASNGTTVLGPNELPITPAITPALSVAGAYLVISGALYTLIGIKTKWLHIFLSAAYLTSLAVTVLIIYVMHPPISNAIQGAYFVAIWITGIIFGGGSVVFADVTEGLGCLFGGFCLSMWFLVLKSGGLIPSTAGRAIFIACFTLGTFGLYVSHYTRAYGLIGSTSFGGATVIVLGIDCFSRAGLKEFWLYTWDLNKGLFPFHYSGPYPITRGIRVEVACIVLLFFLGVMSQIKVWKVIKERRDKKVSAQLEEDRRRDQAEEDLGRCLEEGNGRERLAWEAVYGDGDRSKQEADSAMETDTCASTRKGSLSAVGIREVRTSGVESIEMSNLGALTNSSQKRSHDGTHSQEHPQVTVRVGAEDGAQEFSAGGMTRIGDTTNFDSRSPIGISIVEPTRDSAEIVSSANPNIPAAGRGTLRPKSVSYSKGPEIIPLPFRVPDGDAEIGDDTSSIATFAASDQIPVQISHRLPTGERWGNPAVHLERNSRNISEEALLVPHIEDDGASSVAATVDGVSTDEDFEDGDLSKGAQYLKSTKSSSESLSQPMGTNLDSFWRGFDGLDQLKALLTLDGRTPDEASQDPKSVEVTKVEQHAEENAGEKLNRNRDSSDAGNDSGTRRLVSSGISESRGQSAKLQEKLPASKVMMAYRTNEWAKHLEAAESPELDDLMTGSKPGGLETTEHAAPVHIKDLQQTALTAEPAAILSNNQQHAQNVGRSLSATSKDSLVNHPYPQGSKPHHRPSIVPNAKRSSSQLSLPNAQPRKESPNSSQLRLSLSQTSLTANRGYRSSSTPITNTPLVESPIAEGVEVSFPSRVTPSPMNLMSKRDSMIRNKPSSTSLNRFTPSPIPPLASTSNEYLPTQTQPQDLATLDEEEIDNIPLSQRKSLLLQQQQHQLHQNPSRSSLLLASQSQPLQPQPQHQHSSSSLAANRRASTLSLHAWRSSLQADLPAQQAAHEKLESRRTDMINEKRRTSTTQQWAQLEAGKRESEIDGRMRKGEFLDLHREAMRKMQGVANRNL